MLKSAIISEVRFYEDYSSKIPVAVIVDAETNAEVGYLAPFRGYRFQVSRTFEGHTDLGSSAVIGLNNVLHTTKPSYEKPQPKDLFAVFYPEPTPVGYNSNLNWSETKVEMLAGQAALALAKFTSYPAQNTPHGNSYFVDIYTPEDQANRTLSNGRFVPGLMGTTKFMQFIYETIIWLNPRMADSITTDKC